MKNIGILLAAGALIAFAPAAVLVFAERKPATLELHILNQTVEEGSWFSARPSDADLKPLCGRIELHAIYSSDAQALTLLIDGIVVDERQETDARFIWDTKGWPDGEHQVVIQASDAEGSVLDSFSLNLDSRTESDTTPPSVTITFPQEHSVVRGTVAVQVQAKDDHDVARVRLEVDGKNIGTKEHFPYTFSWDTLKVENGVDHHLVAKAEDSSGNEGRSDTVTVQVSNLRQLLKNPNFQGIPPAEWELSGKCSVMPRQGGGCSIAPLPGVLEPAGVEQAFELTRPICGALLALQLRLEGASSSSSAPPPPLLRVELWQNSKLLLFSWESPNPNGNYVALTETVLPLPMLETGKYSLRLLAVPATLSQSRWEIEKVSLFAP
jgi:hypothetical protein